jgi:hypothetical protein
MLLTLLFSVYLEAKLEQDVLVLTVDNETASPQLVTGFPDAEVIVGKPRRGVLVFERVLEMEDLGPIARAPMPPRWTKADGEPMRGAYYVPANGKATIRIAGSGKKRGDAFAVKVVRVDKPWLLAEHGVEKVTRDNDGGRREFGKFVPYLRVTARYEERVPARPMVERPEWRFDDFSITDAPPLSAAWPAVVSLKEADEGKLVKATIE